MMGELASQNILQWMGLIFLLLVSTYEASPVVSTAPPVKKPTAHGKDRYKLDTALLDLNQDGCIGGKEELDAFKYHVASALAGTPNNVLRAHSIVHRADVNKDGRICWCDFISIFLHDKVKGNKHSVPFQVLPDSDMFSQLDKNNDGQLTDKERETLEKEFETCLPSAEAKIIVKNMANLLTKDESISLKEFQKYLERPKHHLIYATPAINKNKN